MSEAGRSSRPGRSLRKGLTFITDALAARDGSCFVGVRGGFYAVKTRGASSCSMKWFSAGAKPGMSSKISRPTS